MKCTLKDPKACENCPYGDCINDDPASYEELELVDDAMTKKEPKTTEAKRESNKRYYQEHKEGLKAYYKRYASENKEKIRRYRRQYYLDHREKALAYQREYDRKKRESK